MKLLITIILCLTGLDQFENVNVTKQKGETVVFHMNTTELPLKEYRWIFDHNDSTATIALVEKEKVTVINGTRFEGRISTDVDTGFLTISNLTIGDSGYFVLILTETQKEVIEYYLIVRDTHTVLVGDNVTLQTGIHLEPDHRVSWTQGRDFIGKEIAKYENNNFIIDKDMKDFLLLDLNSGSLIFINIIKELSGYYCLEVWEGLEEHSRIQFFIDVYKKVSTPQISSEPHLPDSSWSCHITCCVENKPDVTLNLYKEDTVINCTSSRKNSTDLCLLLEISRPSEDTYRCEAANPVCKESVTFNSTYCCPRPETGFSRWMIGIIVLSLLVPLVVVVGGLWVGIKRKKDRRRPTSYSLGCLEIRKQNLSHESFSSQVSEERLGRDSEDLLRNEPQQSYSSFT